MPFVNVELVDGVFTSEQKHQMAAAGRSTAMYESIDGHPVTWPDVAAAAPVQERPQVAVAEHGA